MFLNTAAKEQPANRIQNRPIHSEARGYGEPMILRPTLQPSRRFPGDTSNNGRLPRDQLPMLQDRPNHLTPGAKAAAVLFRGRATPTRTASDPTPHHTSSPVPAAEATAGPASPGPRAAKPAQAAPTRPTSASKWVKTEIKEEPMQPPLEPGFRPMGPGYMPFEPASSEQARAWSPTMEEEPQPRSVEGFYAGHPTLRARSPIQFNPQIERFPPMSAFATQEVQDSLAWSDEDNGRTHMQAANIDTGVLSQSDGGPGSYAVGYAARRTTTAEANLSATEDEEEEQYQQLDHEDTVNVEDHDMNDPAFEWVDQYVRFEEDDHLYKYRQASHRVLYYLENLLEEDRPVQGIYLGYAVPRH